MRSKLSESRPRYGSIRFRLTAMFVVIFGTTLIIFSALLYSAFTRNNTAEFDAALFNLAVDVANSTAIDAVGGVSIGPDILSSGGKIFPFSLGKSYLQILNNEGKPIARTGVRGRFYLPLYAEDWLTLSGPGSGAAFRTVGLREILRDAALPNTSYRLVSYMVQDRGPQRFILQLAVPLSLIEQEDRGLLVFFFIAIPLTLVLATFGGLFLSRRALAPVAAIIGKTKSLNPGNLAERIPVPSADDEMKQLTFTLNDLLDRLQQAFESQERFIADASHELKTPLAILRGELDLMKSKPRSPEEISEFFSSASQELNHLIKTVEDLLLLARADAGAGSLAVQKLRLDELVLEVVAKLEVLARARMIKIRVDLIPLSEEGASRDFETVGDPYLLQSMLRNLVENAIKYSASETTVDVTVREEPLEYEIMVKDHGPGIRSELLSKIFDRFYRIRNRDSNSIGVGLGLPIARRIAEAHGGTLVAQSSTELPETGTSFFVRIKKL